MINKSLIEQIEWRDPEEQTCAKDIIKNYELWIGLNYKDRLKKINNDIYLDDKLINMELEVNKIAEMIYEEIGIKKKSTIKLIIKALAAENTEIQKNEISDKYSEEFNDIQENIDNKSNALSEIIEIIDEAPDNDWDIYKKWKKDDCLYIRDKDGIITGVDMCYMNIINWLNVFPYTKDKIYFNNIRNVCMWDNKPLNDEVLHIIMQMINKYLSKDYGNLKALNDAIKGCAIKSKRNVWVEYFDNLQYVDDGIDYIDFTIKEVLKCRELDKYYKLYYETLKIMLIAEMKRIIYKEKYNITVKYDYVTTFCSEAGGSGKTTFLEKLHDIDDNGISYCYVVSGDAFKPGDKDFIAQTHQSVCVLIDEINMKRNIVTSVKGYITQQKDNWRAPFAYNAEDHIRGFILTATSNNTDFLKDYTTNNERRYAIIKVTEDSSNAENVNKHFNNGYRDKLWAYVKHIYETEEVDLWFKDKELENLESEIQRGYKASNNDDYNTIIDDLLEREYGFVSNNGNIDIDYIAKQYQYEDCKEWCLRHNEEMNIKLEKSKKGEYVLKPEDKLIQYWGKINRISKNKLYSLLDKLNIDYTKPSLNAEFRDSQKWNGWNQGKRQCRIDNILVNAYWRIEESSLCKFDFISKFNDNIDIDIPF